ncbi:MAG: YihY family inner membrane protein [Gammaproteobacteria bacterium]|nr:YihY family inner membrane protein [Gammaproteobacteria bacterium]
MAIPVINLIFHQIDRMWQVDATTLAPIQRKLVLGARVLHTLFRDLMSGEISVRAGHLAFTSLLSIVPLLALTVSVLKLLGVQYELEPLLWQFLIPLGENGMSVGNDIVQFVDRIDVKILGFAGIIVFFYTAVSLISSIESALNNMWHVEAQRNIFKRFGYYLSVILFAPVFMVAAIGVMAGMMNLGLIKDIFELEPIAMLLKVIGILLPYVLSILAFALVYVALPNTRVKLFPATSAAVVAGIIWKTAGWVFATFVVTTTRYHAIYSGLAILVLFMVWVQMSWLIFLLGGKLAYLLQNPYRLMRRGKIK